VRETERLRQTDEAIPSGMAEDPLELLPLRILSIGVQPANEGWTPPWKGLPHMAGCDVPVDLWSRRSREAESASSEGWTVERVESGSSLRRAGALLKTHLAARHSGADAGWVWELKGDPILRQRLRDCDLVLSRDECSDRALAHLTDITTGKTVILSDGSARAKGESVWTAALDWHEMTKEVGGALKPPVDRHALSRFVEERIEVVKTLVEAGVPWAFAPVADTLEMMHDALYWSPGEIGGDEVVRRIGMELLRDGPFWASGSLETMDRWIRLRTQSSNLDEPDLRYVSEKALAAAELAHSFGNKDASRCHLLASMNVTLHRSRHSQRHTSTLVDETKSLIGGLIHNTTRCELTDSSRPRPGERLRARGGQEDRPSVVVLPGPFGQFHTDVVNALAPETKVDVSKLCSRAGLRRRRPIPLDLKLLAALREGRVDLGTGTLDGAEIAQGSLRRLVRTLMLLKIELSHHDVAFSDWGEAQTFWASHICPSGTRLVVRWHGLDLFDEWLHLIDWRGVDEVFVTTGALKSFFEDLTHGLGAPDPTLIGPYLPRLKAFKQPKLAEARHTLGMVGWGRMVKDPSFAIDLLEADPRRKLVLIGPYFPETVDPSVQGYVDEVMNRISNPALADRITVVGPTDDVAGHLRHVGVILSCSFREGWHLGFIEGVASGAVPVLRDWPMLAKRQGAASVFPRSWIVKDLEAAHEAINAVANEDVWLTASASAQEQLGILTNPSKAQGTYRSHILGPLVAAFGRR